MLLELQPGEVNLGTWSIVYIPPVGREYAGHLTVTNRRLLYAAAFDSSFKEMIAKVPLVTWGVAGTLEFDKNSFKS